jgi:hypothetical protein
MDGKNKKKPSSIVSDNIRSELRERLHTVNGFWSEQYDKANRELEFSSGYQWDPDTEAEREEDDRPSLVMNFTRTLINNVVNPLRLHPMGIKVSSENEEFTELVSDIFRSVEYQSRAQESYDIAYENAVTCGFGFVKIGLDYEDDEGLDQKICIDPVRNPLTVFLDPYSNMIDGSDANYGVQVEYVDSKSAKEEFGEDVGNTALEGINVYDNWTVPEDSVADLMYYVMETEKAPRYWYEGQESYSDEEIEGAVLKRSRMIDKKVCKCYRFVGQLLVEESTLPLPFIPLIPFYGDRLHSGDVGNFLWAGIVHWVKDSQKMVNFYASNEAELASLAPKAPYIAEESQIAKYTDIWATANTKNHSFLPYKATSIDGTPIGPPQRANNTVQSTGLIESRNQAQADMGRASGIFDNQLGEKQTSQETGLAVLTRKSQGELNTAQYASNFRQSLAQVARVVLHTIPYAFDTPRLISVRDEHGEVQKITANLSEIITPQVLRTMDVTTDGGPAHADKKTQSIQAILAIAQVDPTAMPLMRDQLVRNLDLPGTGEIADRLEKMLPASLQDGFNAEETLQKSQELEAENAELKATLNQLQTKIIDNEKDRSTDIQEEIIKAEAKIAAVRIQETSADDRQAAQIEADARGNFTKAAAEVAKAELASKPEPAP